MIEEHWGLARKPFANTPDPAFVFHSPAFDEGFARLLYDVTELRSGLSLITGEIGCGKTMLASALGERLRGTRHEAVVIEYPRLTPTQLLQTLATALGVEKLPRTKPALVAALGGRLRALHGAGRRPVVIMDEAQLATPGLLEEMRLLTNFEDHSDKHVHVVLLGQPELRDRIGARPQIDQRISLRFHLVPLERHEVEAYVRHRLGVAGARAVPFESSAFDVLAERSGGIPRLINNLATQALFVGAMRGLDHVDRQLVTDVADDRA